MKPGDLVIVLGKRDSRVRQKDEEQLAIGTFDGILCDNQVYILLPDGEIWIGLNREVRLYEQEATKKEEAEEKGAEEENGIDDTGNI